MNIKTCIHIIAALLFAFTAKAQELRVVKDNVNCTYGLKDEGGKWVVKAKYASIRAVDIGFFEISDGVEYGLLNRKGKLIIPMEYEEIKPLFHSWIHVRQLSPKAPNTKPLNVLFRVKKQSEYGLLNKNGKTLFPIKYESIIKDAGTSILLHKKHKQKYRSTYADSSGRVRIDTEGYLNPFRKSWFAVISDLKYIPTGVNGNAGVMQKNGSLIIPRGNENVYINHERTYNNPQAFIVLNDGKREYLDARAQPIKPPLYRVHSESYYGRRDLVSLNAKEIYVISDSSSQYGLMRGDEQIVLKPQFSWIKKHSTAAHFSDYYYWIAYTKNGKMGVLSPAGEISIKPIYDTLFPVAVVRGDDRQKAGQRYHFVVRQNGKYGLITEEGRVLEPMQNRQFFRAWQASGEYYYFVNENAISSYQTTTYPAIKKSLEFVARHDFILLYRGQDGLMPFIQEPYPSYQISAQKSEAVTYKTYGELFTMTYKRRSYLFYEADGRVWYGNKVVSIYGNRDLLIIKDANGLKGLVDGKSGKMIIPPKYYDFELNQSSYNKIWVNTLNPKTNPSYYCGKWQLVNRKGEFLSPFVFDKPTRLSGITYPSSNGLRGMFDADQMKWIIPPQFCSVYSLPNTHVWVATESGKVGLMNASGQWLADTIYEELVPIYNSDPPHRKMRIGQEDYAKSWYELKTPLASVFIDQDGVFLKDSAQMDSIKTASAFYSFLEPSEMQKRLEPYRIRGEMVHLTKARHYCQECFRVEVKLKSWEDLKRSSLKTDIYYTIRSSIPPTPVSTPDSKRGVDCTSCPHLPNIIRNRYPNTFTLDFVNDFSFSFQEYQSLNYTDPIGMPVMTSELSQVTYNYIKQKGAWQRVNIEDVFGKGDLLREEYELAVSQRDDLKLDCSNLENVAALVAHKWTFSKSGIVIYVNNPYQDQQQPGLLIPWGNLVKHKESKAFANRFL